MIARRDRRPRRRIPCDERHSRRLGAGPRCDRRSRHGRPDDPVPCPSKCGSGRCSVRQWPYQRPVGTHPDEPAFDSWRRHPGDVALLVGGWLMVLWAWVADRKVKDRLADVEVPHGVLLPIVMFTLIGQRRRDRVSARFGTATGEFGTFIGTRMRDTDERQQRLVELQASLEELTRAGEQRERRMVALQESVERYTRVLVILTVVLAALGLGAIGATVWAATR